MATHRRDRSNKGCVLLPSAGPRVLAVHNASDSRSASEKPAVADFDRCGCRLSGVACSASISNSAEGDRAVGIRTATAAAVVCLITVACGGAGDDGASESTASSSTVAATRVPDTVAVTGPPTSAAPPVTMGPSLEELVGASEVEGWLGPLSLPDGREAVWLSRHGTIATLEGGAVELLIGDVSGWDVAQTITIGLPGEPVAEGDLDGDGYAEVSVVDVASTGGSSMRLFRLDPQAVAIYELVFADEEIETLAGGPIDQLLIDHVRPGVVRATILNCVPTCMDQTAQSFDFTLDPTTQVLRPVPPSSGERSGSLDTSLPLAEGMSGPAVRELQQRLIEAGISVGSDGADGSFGGNTARAVSMLDRSTMVGFDGEGPGEAGVMTAARLALLQARAATEPAVVEGARCPSRAELVAVVGASAPPDVFAISDVQCMSGWVKAYFSEYGFADTSQLFFRFGASGLVEAGGAYGPENGCATNGLPPSTWEFFGCA